MLRTHTSSVHIASIVIAITIGFFAAGMWSIAYAQDAPPIDDTGTTIATPTTNTPPQKVVECQAGSWIGDPSGNLKCAGASLIISILAGLNSLFTTILQWATSAFSFAIEKTIVNFKVWFDSVNKPIAEAWTLFRDLANIAIIGIFVFIAISIILGLQEYGQKKLIARVIIIATLINFSFLFTVIIINSSNLFASTIYKSMPIETDKITGQPLGIGEQFVRYMGVYSYRDTSNLLMQKYNDPTQGFGAMFAYGAFSALFALSAAAVFLYGALLLFARAVILAIVLLPISSLAFATYLAPSFEETGWKRWWHSLLQQSFLAPLLMLFVLISLNIAKTVGENAKIAAEQAAASGQASALANFASNPGSSAAWNSAFTFIVILGSLLAGIYIASQLAGGAARRFAAVGSILPGAILARGVVAPAGRWFIGGRAAMSAHNKEHEMESRSQRLAMMPKDDPRRAKLEKEWMSLSRQKGRRDTLAKSSFDLMNTKAMSKLGTTAGLPSSLSGKSAKSYEHSEHEQSKKAMEEAVKAAASKGDVEKLARKEHGATDTDTRTSAERTHEEASKALKAAEQAAHSAKQSEGLITQMRDAQTELMATKDTVSSNKKAIAENAALTTAQKQIATKAEDKKIEEINMRVRGIRERMEFLDEKNTGAARSELKSAQQALKEEKSELTKRVAEARENSSMTAQNIAVARAGGPIVRALRGAGMEVNKLVADGARNATKKRVGIMDKVKQRNDLRDATGEKGSGHAPAGGDSHATTGH
ncbi:MAG: hypothetical protein RLZZ342_643 [Candidatus Parcubacteria bacterium]